MIELIAEKVITVSDKLVAIPAHKKVAPALKGVKSWRLVHDGKKVQTLFESEGDTRTKLEVFESTTEQGCLDEIKRLGLTYTPDGGVVKEVVKEPIPLDPELIK